MSTAKERYYSLIEDFEIGVLQEIIDYVTELEQQVEELKKALIGCTSAMFHYDTVIKAAEQNYAVELLKKYGGTKP